MKEVWKDVVGYEGAYMVSNIGRIKSLERRVKRKRIVPEVILKPYINQKGYIRVTLGDGGSGTSYEVQRLVAKAFIPNPENKPEVNHKDFNRQNNNVSNLEWCTHKENIIHSYTKENRYIPKGETHSCSKVTDKQVIDIRKREIPRSHYAIIYGLTYSGVRSIQNGQSWKHLL